MKGYWSHTYSTPKHLVDLYQASIIFFKKKKEKEKGIEMNFANHSDPIDPLVLLDILNG
jgi:hypothetical protein